MELALQWIRCSYDHCCFESWSSHPLRRCYKLVPTEKCHSSCDHRVRKLERDEPTIDLKLKLPWRGPIWRSKAWHVKRESGKVTDSTNKVVKCCMEICRRNGFSHCRYVVWISCCHGSKVGKRRPIQQSGDLTWSYRYGLVSHVFFCEFPHV